MLRIKERFNIEEWERTLYIMFAAQLVTAVGFSSIFPFLPLYVEELGSAYGLSVELLAGLVFSLQAFTMMLASPFWGNLADRYGRKLMVQRALYGGAVLLTLMALVQNAEQLVLMRGIQGLVTGSVAANAALVAAVVPRKQAGYAMGLMQVGQGAGVALGPLLGGVLADMFDYYAAFYGTGLMLLLSGLMVTFWVKEEFDPESVPPKARITQQIGDIIHLPGTAATYGMRFLSTMGRMMIVPIMPFLIQSLDIGEASLNTYVGLVLGVTSGATTLSAVFLGKLGDQIGSRKVLIASMGIAGLLYFPQGAATHGWQILVLQGLTGVAMGGVIPSISALLARYTPPEKSGAVYGLDNSINAAGRAVAPLLGGAVAVWFSQRATFPTTGILLVLAATTAWVTLPKRNEGVGIL
jgi:DHA1 family multidrug resistance protein-like MFS transporter